MMTSSSVDPLHPDLSDLGWTPFFQSQLAGLPPDLLPARVAVEHRGRYELLTPRGPLQATLSGRLSHEATSRLDLPAVGDWVAVRCCGQGEAASIGHVFSRATCFVRQAAGRRTDAQVVAANIDVVAIVSSLNSDFNLRRFERYLLAVRQSGAQPMIVLNKSDLCADPERLRAEAQGLSADIPVLLASAFTGAGIDEIRAFRLPGQTIALVGSSGVGKSALTNRLLGQDAQAVGEIRQSDERGQHTTTHRELLLMPGGGLLIDTPGMRELQIWAGEGAPASGFDEVASLAQACRFRDCSHQGEPGCEVVRAVEQGRLPGQRLEHLHKIERELAHQREKQDIHSRQAVKQRAKRLSKAVRRMHKH